MTLAPTITTDRLILRHHVMDDFEPLYQVLESDRAEFLGGKTSREDSWYWIAAEVGSWSLVGHGSWGVERREDGAFLGQVGINQPYDFPEQEIGWVLVPEAEGKGYATEAAGAALDWARRVLKPASLVSYIDPQNNRSIALAKRLGATLDKDAALPEGETPEETIVYRHDVGALT